MAELNIIENLLAAREVLKSGLEKSRDIAFAIDKTGPRLKEMDQQIPSLEAAIKAIACKCTLFAARDHVGRVIGPASAVVKIFDVVRELEDSLSAKPSSDLFGYLSNLKRLEEALRLLTDNCKLVILWLEDLVQFLEDNKVADDWYLSNVKKSLRILLELQATEERSRLNGGFLNTAFGKLEKEFKHLERENSFPLPVDSSLPPCNADSLPLPLPIIQKLQAIIERLAANNRLDKCICTYIKIRSSNARKTLQTLDLDYLEISLSEFDSVQSIEGSYIDQWGRDLEFVVKRLLELEYRLCNEVFQKLGLDVSMDCFAKIAIQSGMDGFIKFGNTITKSKREAIKLFKLLDIFAVLNKLRLDFNRLFGGKSCVEIQAQTRDLIEKVVNGVCEIFWELSVQVERQRQITPPSDGSVPRLVSFVTDYSNQLLDDNYKPTLTQVLEIHWSWNHEEKFEKGLLSHEVHHIVKTLELDLDTWSKTYGDTALSYLFMMNNHCHFYKNLMGTKLGDLMGDPWLRGHKEYMEYYAVVYVRESWGKLPALLNDEGLILFSGGRAIARDLARKRIEAFSYSFDETYMNQSSWVVPDKALRWKTWEFVVEVIVPVYRSYMKNYMPLGEEESQGKYVKYSAERLEDMVRSLFHPKLGKNGSRAKCAGLVGKMKNVVSNCLSSTSAAA